MFADKVQIDIFAGKGGDGKLSFRREKYIAKGGADGGNGGHGGNVIIVADHNQNTLSNYRTNRRVKADEGQPGGDNDKAGRAGDNSYVRVPVGTMIFDITGEIEPRLMADLGEDGQELVIAKGGRGGFGNAHFQSSTRQSPRIAELGEPGELFTITMELKLVADIGLVGLPNAGKSTLLSVISNAKPEIGDYPFTTLIPNLGVVDMDNITFLVADIPGLIEGASEGKGLGDEFLRHIERTAVLLHLIDARSTDIVRDYDVILGELAAYEVDLSHKPQLVVITKIDGLEGAELTSQMQALEKHIKGKIYTISATAHKGLDILLRAALPLVLAARTKAIEDRLAQAPIIDMSAIEIPWAIEQNGESEFIVTGTRIEGFAKRTNFDQPEAVIRLRDILNKMGIAKELEKRGVKSGDTIKIAGRAFGWL